MYVVIVTILSWERDIPGGIWRIALGNLKAGHFKVQRSMHVPFGIYSK